MNKFIITEEERSRILNMHVERTKNQYLTEESDYETEEMGGDFTIDGVEDFDFPNNPNHFNKWHIEELLKVYDVDDANEILESHYPGYSLEIQMETPYGKSIGFMSPEGEQISGNYIIGCCGGRGSSENMDRFRKSDDAFYDPRKRY
jgi:hypothetical protein